MADIFTRENVLSLMKGGIIWFLGDSNIRALYKDFLWLCTHNTIIPQSCLKAKLEKSFLNDTLVAGDALSRGRSYVEDRYFTDRNNKINANFIFLTRCSSDRFQEQLRAIKRDYESPDVVVINSCLWDITRWGPDSVAHYKVNLMKIMQLMKKHFFPHTLVLWVTAPPVSSEIKGGFLINQLQFMANSCRFEVMEANLFARDVVVAHGYDVIDSHFYLALQPHNRSADGIHWCPTAIRFLTNLILTHISLTWEVALPGNFESRLVQRLAETGVKPREDLSELLRKLQKVIGPQQPLDNQRRQYNRQRPQNNEPRKRGFQRNNYYNPY